MGDTAGGADLFVTPGPLGQGDDGWQRVLPADPADVNVLVVTIMGSPERWVERWRSLASAPPAHLGFVDAGAGDTTRAASQQSGDKRELGAGLSVRTVGEPGDLTGLGIAISEYLTEWADTDRRTLVYVDSLTPLLQYADVAAVARFLHIITKRIENAGGQAYLHLNPDAHDERTVATLESMVDGVVTSEEPDEGT